MFKRIIILSTALIILSLLVLGFTNANTKAIDASVPLQNNDLGFENQITEGPIDKVIPALYYGIDTRFAGVKKSDVEKATTLYDFLNDGEKQQIVQVNSVDIIIIKNNQHSNIREYGTSDQLTDAQLKLIRSMGYFNHFKIKTEFKERNVETGKLQEGYFGPHITVVPDKQATYSGGKDALIKYLKDYSRNDMNIIEDNIIGAIKLSFKITKEGTVSEVKHDAMTTGYPSIDEKFMTLIKNLPGTWTPAENSKGEKIEQELIFTFGPADGC